MSRHVSPAAAPGKCVSASRALTSNGSLEWPSDVMHSRYCKPTLIDLIGAIMLLVGIGIYVDAFGQPDRLAS